ncbi:MAG: TetR/AcrR family transcriptional regulator [Bacteroidia bacterium]
MIEKKTDRRILRTRRMLFNSLIELILEKGYDAVSVQDIIDRADVGRSTFYAHFENKQHLLFSANDQLGPKMGHEIATNHKDFFTQFYQHAADNYDLARAMLGKGGGKLVVDHFQMMIEAYFLKQTAPPISASPTAQVLAKALSSSTLGILSTWLEMGMSLPQNQLIGYSVASCEHYLGLLAE